MSLTTCWCLVLVVALAAATGYSTGTYILESTLMWVAFAGGFVALLVISICNDVANARTATHHLPEMDA